MATKRTSRPSIKYPLLIVVLLILPCSQAHAGAKDVLKNIVNIAQSFELPDGAVGTSFGFVSEAQIDSTDAKMSRQDYGIAGELGVFSFDYKRSNFNWKNTEALSFGDDKSKAPWKSLNSINLGTTVPFEINKQWGAMFAINAATNYESTLSADSIEVATAALAQYAYSEDLTFQFGISVGKSPLNWNISPALGMQYTYEDWAFSLGMPSTSIEYTLNEDWKFRTEYRSESTLYKLSSNNAAIRDGYTEISSSVVGLYADWTPTENIYISAGPEYSFGRKTQLYNDNGNKLDYGKPKNAWGGSVNFAFIF